jgi:recombination protein RecA
VLATKRPAPAKQRTEVKADSGSDFASLVAGLKKKHPGKVFQGDEYTMPWALRRLPTGLLDLDLALNGGCPAGGMTMLVGQQSVGKNFLANRIMANQQRIYGDRCRLGIVSTEMSFDKDYGHSCGLYVPLSSEEIEAYCRSYFALYGVDPDYDVLERKQEKRGEVLIIPPSTAEESLEIAIDLARSRQFNAVLVDSFGSLLTESEEEKSFSENAKVGGASGLNTQFARKLNAAMAPDAEGNPNLTCLIGINQVRDNMHKATPFSPTKVETGGWALKHGRFVTIELNAGAKINKETKVDGKDVKLALGKEVYWEIVKQKAGGHEGARGSYNYYYGMPGWDPGREVLKAASRLGLIKKTGAWYNFEGEALGNGLDAAAQTVNERPELIELLTKAAFLEAGVHCNH